MHNEFISYGKLYSHKNNLTEYLPQYLFWLKQLKSEQFYYLAIKYNLSPPVLTHDKIAKIVIDGGLEELSQNLEIIEQDINLFSIKPLEEKQEQVLLTLSQDQAIALRNFLSEHAYPTMHEQPEIAAIFDELQQRVGM